jgi:AhpD family alkylhydroperoxidase
MARSGGGAGCRSTPGQRRASQINGCAYCLDMHTKDARALGETEQRIHVLAAWREAPFYTERERAVLAWAESVTRVAETHVPDEIYEEARRHLEEEELITLTWAVVAVNSWNRLLIATRQPADTYRSPYERASEQERETREAVAV